MATEDTTRSIDQVRVGPGVELRVHTSPGRAGRFHEAFHRFAGLCARIVGSPTTFALALGLVALWALSGPLFGFSDTWQLVINTSTTVVTFLVVFLLQHSQNHDSRAVHLKLDELLRAIADARNDLVDLEDRSEEEVDRWYQEFKQIRAENPEECSESSEERSSPEGGA